MLKNEPILKLQIALELQWSELQLHNKWKVWNPKSYNNLSLIYTLSTILWKIVIDFLQWGKEQAQEIQVVWK